MKIFLIISIVLMAEFVKVPSYSLTPDRITLFERLEWNGFSDRQKKAFENLKNNESKYNDISEAGRKRLLNAVSYLLYMAKEKDIIGQCKKFKHISDNEILTEKEDFDNKKEQKYKLTFITLTLSAAQIHSDTEITAKLLNSFLNSMRRKWNVDKYVWKAEKQENGNIHYHILTDRFIYWKEIREVWNRIQNNLGYVDRYSENMKAFFKNGFRMSENPKDKRTRAKQYAAYVEGKKNEFTDPNSTDIHALYKVKNIPAYIAKYISKPITKTERTQKIDQLLYEIDCLKISLESLREELKTIPEFTKEWLKIAQLESECFKAIQESEKELTELKNKGITGRIWGQSQSLSKIKPFVEVESFSNIPDIEIVDKTARYKHEIDIGNENKIMTYYFDIDKTPQLKAILNNHIRKSIDDEPDLFSNMNYQEAANNFYNA